LFCIYFCVNSCRSIFLTVCSDICFVRVFREIPKAFNGGNRTTNHRSEKISPSSSLKSQLSHKSDSRDATSSATRRSDVSSKRTTDVPTPAVGSTASSITYASSLAAKLSKLRRAEKVDSSARGTAHSAHGTAHVARSRTNGDVAKTVINRTIDSKQYARSNSPAVGAAVGDPTVRWRPQSPVQDNTHDLGGAVEPNSNSVRSHSSSGSGALPVPSDLRSRTHNTPLRDAATKLR